MAKIYDVTILLSLVIFANILIYELIQYSNQPPIIKSPFITVDNDPIEITLSECDNLLKSRCNETMRRNENFTRYIDEYPEYMSCKNGYNDWKSSGDEITPISAKQLYNTRFIRGVIVYFPLEDIDRAKVELKWLYRSWIHMLQFEPSKWRTDLIVFVKNEPSLFGNSDFFLNLLKCSFDNRRLSDEDPPMCTLVDYKPLKERNFTMLADRDWESEEHLYDHLLNSVNIFDSSGSEFDSFYRFINNVFNSFGYGNNTDSILATFEGYEYFKSAGYNFLFRAELGTFLTPLFATWLPYHCNSFFTIIEHQENGTYSSEFNKNRLRRIANYMGLTYACEQDIGGQIWYSTPDQFRLVSYMTLFAMAYLAQEEFSPVERDGKKIGDLLFPDWYYPNLSLYAQNLVINHLIASNQAHVAKLDSSNRSIRDVIFVNPNKVEDIDNSQNENEIYSYCLKIVLDAKRLTSYQFTDMLETLIKQKKI